MVDKDSPPFEGCVCMECDELKEDGDELIDELVKRIKPRKTFAEKKREEIFGDARVTKVSLTVPPFMALPAILEFDSAMDVKRTWGETRTGKEDDPVFQMLDGEEVLFGGVREYEVNGCPVTVDTYNYGPDEHKLDFYYRREDKEKIEPVRNKVWKRIEDYEWFRGKTLHFTGNLSVLTPAEGLSFDELVLDDKTKQSIIDNTLSYLEDAENLKGADLEVRRGVLLSGPPGNGKTKLCKIASANVPEGTTTIWVTGSSILHASHITKLFDIARRLSPTLLIIEDVDAIGGNRENSYSTPASLGELLTQMDGIGDTGGIITIATTNYAEKVDDALKERPRRFDRHFVLPALSSEGRLKLLQKHLPEFEDGSLRRVASKLEGRSGAVVEEVVHTAKVAAMRNDEEVNDWWLEKAVEDMQRHDPSRLSSPEII